MHRYNHCTECNGFFNEKTMFHGISVWGFTPWHFRHFGTDGMRRHRRQKCQSDNNAKGE